jgi:Fe-S-cluster containining protein
MFTQSDTIHFSCTQCGGCCQKSPFMHFYDMLELSDEFFFQTAHHAVISYAHKPLEESLLNHYKAIGHTIVMPEDGIEASLFYFIDFIPVSYPSYKTCPKLDNNLCSIYGKRPTSCRIAPLDAKFDDSQQWRTLNYFKKNVEENKWKCNFSNDQPILFKDEQIYHPNSNALYFQSVDAIRDITDKYIEFLSVSDKKYLDTHFKAVFKSITDNSLMISDMIIPLQAARFHNIIRMIYLLVFK